MFRINKNGLILDFNFDDVAELVNIELENSPVLDRGVADKESKPKRFAFNQVQAAGRNRQTTSVKMIMASESITAKFVKTNTYRHENSDIYEIITENELVRIISEFTFFDGVKAFSVKNTVVNISNREITLEEVNALSFSGIGGCDTSLERNKNINLFIPHNSWHTEAQWKKYSLDELGLFSGNGRYNWKNIRIANTGAQPTKEYLPMGVLEDTKKGLFTAWQIESNGSWSYEIGECDGRIYINAGGPNFMHNMWSVRLKPDEKMEGVSCAFTFGKSFEDVIGNLTAYRRKIRRPNADNIKMPVIYNCYMHAFWDYPNEVELVPLIDAVAEVGSDYFCIDAGWHDEEDWYKDIGEWKQSMTRFPSGVKKTLDYIKSKGMKAGLWVEIETIGMLSGNLHELPDECYFRISGQPIIKTDRMMLDFSHPLVIERANKVIDYMVSFGADYIKIDYNMDMGAGTDCEEGSIGHGLLKHNRAYLDWIDKLFKKYPTLVIEACASGGCRMDYATLKLHSIQSVSDQVDYKKYPYIAANIFTALTPEQSAVTSFPITEADDPLTLTDEAVIMNMINSLLGRFYLASRLDKLSPHHKELVKEAVKCHYDMIDDKASFLPFLPLGLAKFNDTHVASGLKSDKKLYLAIWNLGGEKSMTIPLNSKIKKILIKYPSKAGKFSCESKNDCLQIEFGEQYQARLLEIELY